MPRAYRELVRIAARLERHYRDMQDIEFTIQRGRLWLLQTRTGKRTARAAVRIAVDLARERRIRRDEAIARVDPAHARRSAAPDARSRERRREPVARGLPASPGAAVGVVVLSADAAEARARAGEKVILVRSRDLARRHPRHARGRGHPHRARRHDLARGGRRARHGQELRGRLQRAARRRRARRDPARRRRGARGRRRSRSTAAAAR